MSYWKQQQATKIKSDGNFAYLTRSSSIIYVKVRLACKVIWVAVIVVSFCR